MLKRLMIWGTAGCVMAAAVAAELSREEMTSLYREVQKSCDAGDFDGTFALIDRFYSYDNTKSQPPYTWSSNWKIARLIGDKTAEQLTTRMANLKTPQARFELWHACARSEKEKLAEAKKETEKKINALRNRSSDIDDLLWDAGDEAAKKALNQEKREIGEQIKLLEKQFDGAEEKRVREVTELYFKAEKELTWVSYYGMLLAARGYHETLKPSPEKGEAVLEILSRKIPGAEPDRNASEAMLEMKIEAMLRLNRGGEALPLIEEQAGLQRFQNPVGKAITQLNRGRALLQMKRFDEARKIAEELEQAGIDTDPLKMNIREFIRAAREAK